MVIEYSFPMNGMIFAAGLGTRLRPLTNDRPKALVEINGKPLLWYVIRRMKEAGIDRIVVNVHHYAGLIEQYLQGENYSGCDIVISDERDELLDTGGGLLKARDLFGAEQDVLIHNVDIFSEIGLRQLMEQHRTGGNYVTLVTRPCAGGRVLKFNDSGMLKGWENQFTGEQKIVDEDFYAARDYSFCGVHIVSPDFLRNMSGKGVFSIIDEYLFQARSHNLQMFPYGGPFLDLGTPEAVAEAERWSGKTL